MSEGIENFVQTVTLQALSADSNRIELANPGQGSPFNLPFDGCSYVLLMERESVSGGGCRPKFVEIIKYDGYEDDGVTLKVVERGVGDTQARDWSIGAVVQQPFLKEHYQDIIDRFDSSDALLISLATDSLKLFAEVIAQSHLTSVLRKRVDELGLTCKQDLDKFQLACEHDIDALADRALNVEHNLGVIEQDVQNIAMVHADQDEYMAEVLRGMGQSGVYLTRQYGYGGQKAFHRPFGVNYSALGVHSHWDFNGILGMAEGSAIIDGRYIRRRHTDYGARMPADTSADFLRTNLIPYPDVPPDVARLAPDEQIPKMREYFEVAMGQRPASDVESFADAFTLCMSYEETWEEEFSKELTDTFLSGRHTIDASNVQELLQKVQYFNAGGHKNRLENISYFHSFVSRVDDEGNVRLSIRKSRVCMMPVGNLEEYPLADIVEQVDDPITRWRRGMSLERLSETRLARFRLKPKKGSSAYHLNKPELIDELIQKIPGLDGVGATLTEDYHQYRLNDRLTEYGKSDTLNAAYYNRFYGLTYNDASNRTNARRGFNDPTLWVAKTTRKEVTPVIVGKEEQRFSRLIPLELVVLTPLHQWNPYGVPDKTNELKWTDYYRNQYGKSEGKPLPGFFRRGGVFYHTPGGFFANTEVPDFDPADTAHPGLFVRCADGVSRKHTASGIPILLPEIKGVGRFRTRFPIPFMYHEGSHAQAYSQALKEDTEDDLAALAALTIGNSTDHLKQLELLYSVNAAN